MKLILEGILWPALGYPADVTPEHETSLRVVVYPPSSDLEPSLITARLTPVGTPQESPIDLACNNIRTCSLDELSDVGNWSPWVRAAAPKVNVLSFAMPAVGPRIRTRVYDLQVKVGPHTYTKPAAAFVRRAGNEDFRIGLATDVHLASRWDEIERDLEVVFPRTHRQPAITATSLMDFSPEDLLTANSIKDAFINPNRNFGNFLRTINQMASEGKIDALILSGDIVDFKFQQPRSLSGNCFHATEWDLFLRMVLGQTPLSDRITVPLFTTSGNHDYRLYPYKLQVYGIRHCGIADEITREYLRRKSQLLKVKYRLEDLDSIRVNTGIEHSLNYYYRDINPCDDYETEIGGLHTIFLDSGPDASSDLSHLGSRRWQRYVRGIFNISSPQSNGLSEDQIRYLERCMEQNDKRSVLLVTHAPLMIPKAGSSPVDSATQLIKLPMSLGREVSGSDRMDDRLRFENQMTEEGLDEGSLMRNQLPCLQALRGHQGMALMLSGHSHRHLEFSLDKKDGSLYRHWRVDERQFESEAELGRVWMLQTPALGHVYIGDCLEGRPAYRILATTRGKIRSLLVEKLCEHPLDSWLYEWRVQRLGENRESIEVYFDPAPTLAIEKGQVRHRLIFRFAGPSAEQDQVMKAQLQRIRAVVPHEEVLASRNWDGAHGEYFVALLFGDVRRVDLIIEGRPSDTRVTFVFESFLENAEGFVSCGLRRHFRDLEPS